MSQDARTYLPPVAPTQAYQSSFHITDCDVRDAVNDDADYLVTYPDEGGQVGEHLSLSRSVVGGIRADMGLDFLFGEDASAAGRDPANTECAE